MIYAVECTFTDADSEAEWNDFYSLDKLPALLSVRGFHGSQRFRALSRGCPVYLALHSIDGPEVLSGDEYRQKGGGNFARWQPCITDWHRGLYSGLERAPAIADGDYLASSTIGPEPFRALGLVPAALRAVALATGPEFRWLAKGERAALPESTQLPDGVSVYLPITAPLTPQ